MRYKCVGSPHCMKTFEYGHALRAHIAACDTAQKILRSRADTEKQEHEISVEYPGVYGLHLNQHFPISHNLDQTLKFNFTDRNKFTPKDNDKPAPLVRQRKAVDSVVLSSVQVKKTLEYPA